MSYILDALRRAEVERARERGKVPGVHDPAPAGAPTATAGEGESRRVAWAIGGVVIVLVAGVAVWALKDHGDAAPGVASVAPVPAPAPSPSMSPVTVAPPPQRVQPAPVAAAPRELMPVPALPRSEAPARAAPAPLAAPTAAPALAASTAGSARIYEASELPEDIRRALPPLTFGGAMYSDAPSARLLIVNGQVVHEGDAVAKGLVLEQIRLKTAVLVFRGYRYLVSY